MHGVLEIIWVGKLRQDRIVGETEFPAINGGQGSTASSCVSKERQTSLRGFLVVRGLLKEQGLHATYCMGGGIGGQGCLGMLCPAGWKLSGASGAPSPWLATEL